MFSKRITFLLKFFDICGFCTEAPNSKTHQKCDLFIFLCHICCAFTLSSFVIKFSMQPIVLNDVLPSVVNTVLQNTGGMFVYWTIMIESYFQRKTQKRFWLQYEKSITFRIHCKSSWLHNYLIKIIEHFIVVIPILVYCMHYFMYFVGNYFFFRLAYFFSIAINQYRVFYYMFYLEIVKYELKNIKSKLQQLEVSSKNVGHDFSNENTIDNDLKSINQYYQVICELKECINQVFGLSNFTTILFCFLLPLTDTNWAYLALFNRTVKYITGIDLIMKKFGMKLIK